MVKPSAGTQSQMEHIEGMAMLKRYVYTFHGGKQFIFKVQRKVHAIQYHEGTERV